MMRERQIDVPFIIVSGSIGEATAVAAMKAGAHDYIMKDNLGLLGPAMDRELREAEVRRQRHAAEEALRKAHEELETRVEQRTAELKRAIEERDRMSAQLLQGQKLQAIGQLSAGIADEINNPLGFMLSNIETLGGYFADLRRLLVAANAAIAHPVSKSGDGAAAEEFGRMQDELDAEFLLKDFQEALGDCNEGGRRIRNIVSGLRAFFHPDPGELKACDINAVMEGALKLLANELKFMATVKTDYGRLDPVTCYAHRLEQASRPRRRVVRPS